ncbi:MAG: 50S ribosomal protein L21 [Firmicutes bacterium]|nr:50S ribosomal protein L21 [Bacillota bacterium]
MYAIVITGGKQYKVSQGEIFRVELLQEKEGAIIELPALFFSNGEKVLAGKDASKVLVKAEVISHGRGTKIDIFTYKAKKNIRKRQGHRQPYTELKVTEIKG